MANKKLLFAMLALTLVFSLAVVACNPDPALNGTWTDTSTYGTQTTTTTYIFNSGNYEYKRVTTYSNGDPSYTRGQKGTYTTSGGIVTITLTQETSNGTTWTPVTPSETNSYLYTIKNGKLVLEPIHLLTK
jgi:hypothetical protein